MLISILSDEPIALKPPPIKLSASGLSFYKSMIYLKIYSEFPMSQNRQNILRRRKFEDSQNFKIRLKNEANWAKFCRPPYRLHPPCCLPPVYVLTPNKHLALLSQPLRIPACSKYLPIPDRFTVAFTLNCFENWLLFCFLAMKLLLKQIPNPHDLTLLEHRSKRRISWITAQSLYNRDSETYKQKWYNTAMKAHWAYLCETLN